MGEEPRQQAAHERVPQTLKDRLLDDLVSEFYAECARAIPRGASLTVAQADTLSVTCAGKDVSHLAQRLIELAFKGGAVPQPRLLSPDEVVQILALAIYDDPAALTLAD